MTYRSISFSAPMVRANRAGLKTQTRRIMKPQPPEEYEQLISGLFSPTVRIDSEGEEHPGPDVFGAYSEDGEYGIKAPMQPGDVCYVREAWRAREAWDDLAPRLLAPDTSLWYEANGPAPSSFGKLRPGMFMSRWMARDWVRIENVRAERVQDITEVDALAEGMREPTLRDLGGDLAQAAWSERQVYARLWRHLHGPDAWERNDWVWAYTYSRIEKPEDV